MKFLVLILGCLSLPAFASEEQIRDPYGFVCGKSAEAQGDAVAREKLANEFIDAARLDYAATRGRASLSEKSDPLVKLRIEIAKALAFKVKFDSLEAIRANWKQLQGLAQAVDSWLVYAAVMEDSIIRRMNEKRQSRGMSPFGSRDLAALISETKEQLKTVIREEPGWSEQQKKQAIAEFENVEPLTASRVRAIPLKPERLLLAMTLLNGCGPNGEVHRAFTVTPVTGPKMIKDKKGDLQQFMGHTRPVMVVCARYITEQSDFPDLAASLRLGIAHQLAHQLSSYVRDPAQGFLDSTGTVVHRDLSSHYSALHACISKHESDFADPRRRVSDLRKRASDGEGSKVAPLEAMMASAEADAIEHRLSDMKQILGHEPSAYEAHQGEIEADYWSFRLLGHFLKGSTEQARAAVRQGLSRFCGAHDEGFYPAPKFRIEMAFQDEALASRIGYKPPTRCWMSGTTPKTGVTKPGERKQTTTDLPVAN
ncbi:MAG TPA: hypothetical protein VM598_01015 [Bdellovibrionota bacterium]|nr:hypothetical protein [Bdellovibrionota bacterium]